MRVLLLGPDRGGLAQAMCATGDAVVRTENRIRIVDRIILDAEFLVSYGYKFIVDQDVLAHFSGRAVNLHISYLPWNRGYHPNVWSVLEDTPAGVTIHVMNSGIDKGDILLQQRMELRADDTFRTSYDRLSRQIEGLFIQNWPSIRDQRIVPVPQPAGGTAHMRSELDGYLPLFMHGWNTPISLLRGVARR